MFERICTLPCRFLLPAKMTVLPMAVLINTAAMVQPPLHLVHGVPPIPDTALITDPPLDARSIAGEGMQ